mmetsp:Transcript_1280/g.3756  ORF Transcript_1280/g.3756 Transcript_1280/m.3756 type:complete len:217 (-) Transcript_1280:3943-4593(-)
MAAGLALGARGAAVEAVLLVLLILLAHPDEDVVGAVSLLEHVRDGVAALVVAVARHGHEDGAGDVRVVRQRPVFRDLHAGANALAVTPHGGLRAGGQRVSARDDGVAGLAGQGGRAEPRDEPQDEREDRARQEDGADRRQGARGSGLPCAWRPCWPDSPARRQIILLGPHVRLRSKWPERARGGACGDTGALLLISALSEIKYGDEGGGNVRRRRR